MNIWIVDDDPACATRLKEEILRVTVHYDFLKFPDIDIFYNPLHFLEKLKKIRKEDEPLIIFLDIQMPERTGIDCYLDLLEEDSRFARRVCFCSSVSYGWFEKFFLSHSLEVPPFVQKSQIDSKIENAILFFYEEQNQKKEVVPKEKKAGDKKKLQQVKVFFEALRDRHYNPAQTTTAEQDNQFLSQFDKTLKNLEELQKKDVHKLLLRLSQLVKSVSDLKTVKGRSQASVFLGLCEKYLKDEHVIK